MPGKFGDMPIVVVGGGPSIEDFIVACKKYDLTKKALIISCDASLRRLLKEGIRPHLVVRCERKLTQIFDGVEKKDLQDIFYIAYPWCDPVYFDLFPESFMVYRNNGICNFLGTKNLEVNGGVSSGNACLEIAAMFAGENSQIILTGIDLAFIDGKSHAEGSMVEFDIEKSKPKWTEINLNDGSKGTSIPVWRRCLAEYNNSIYKYRIKFPGIKIFNTSQKGAVIDYTEMRSWEDLSNILKTEQDAVLRLRTHFEKQSDVDITRFNESVKKGLDVLIDAKKDLMMIFGFVDDAFPNALREESKCLLQIKSHYEFPEAVKTIDFLKPQITSMYKQSSKLIEDFKKKWYTNPFFVDLIVDTCQLDVFLTENNNNALVNIVEFESERLKQFIVGNIALFRTMNFYLDYTASLIIDHMLLGNKEIPVISDSQLPGSKLVQENGAETLLSQSDPVLNKGNLISSELSERILN